MQATKCSCALLVKKLKYAQDIIFPYMRIELFATVKMTSEELLERVPSLSDPVVLLQ